MEVDDEVTQTGDIYISNDLTDTLHLLQFSHFNQYSVAKLRPKQMKLQLQYRHEQTTINLESTPKPMNARYCVGMFDENLDLVLHDVQSIMELKPKLQVQPPEMIIDEEVEVEFKSLDLQTKKTEYVEDWVDLTILKSNLELEYSNEEIPQLNEFLETLIGVDKVVGGDLNKRVFDLFTNAHVLHLDTTLGPESTLLPIFQNMALCVRGCWIVKSEFLYQGRPLHARNYLISLFAEQEYVQRLEFSNICVLPHEVSLNMLEEIAVLEKGKGWKLKLSPDMNFIKEHASIVKEQLKEVKELGKKSLEAIQSKSKVPVKKKIEIIQNNSSKYDDLPIVGATAGEQAKNMVVKMLTSHGALRKPVIIAMFAHQQQQKVAENKLHLVSADDLDTFIEELCLPLQDLFVLKTMGNPILDQYRYTVISLFEKKNQLKKSELLQAWESDVGNTPNASMYSRIMQEVATSKPGGTWTLK